MDIILDSNIFRSDLFFKSNDFDVLNDYLKRTDSRFVLLQIVLEEIKGLYRRLLDEEINNYNKSRKSLNQNLNRNFVSEINIDIEDEVKNYIELVFKKLNSNYEKVIPYKNEYLPEIVNRAINRLKPFKDEDKGFRDSIIWLSSLDYCQKSHEKQIIFISNNPTDFGDIQNQSNLHQHLKKECEDLGIKINYFRTIRDFIEQHSKKIDFITHDWIANNVSEDWISDVICEALNNSNSRRITYWYESKTGNESTEHYQALRAMPYDEDDIFIYEMVDGSLVINYTMQAEIETEFEFYKYDRFGFDEHDSGEYTSVNSDTKYMNGEFYISLIYKNNEICEIEVTDFGIF